MPHSVTHKTLEPLSHFPYYYLILVPSSFFHCGVQVLNRLLIGK